MTLLLGAFEASADSSYATWTAVDGRQIRARLLSVDEGDATFLLESGKRATVAITRFQESDRARIDHFRNQGQYWQRPPRHYQWPTRVQLNWLQETVEVVVEDVEEGRYIYRTPHYEFEADAKLAPNLVKDISRIFEVTHKALSSNPLGLRLSRPRSGYFKIRLFQSTVGYRMAGGMSGAAGVYSTETKQILVPFRSLGLRQANQAWVRRGGYYDPTTLIHEATHQLLDHWLDVAPIWFNEGFADLVGAAQYDSGKLLFNRLEQGMKERLTAGLRDGSIIKDLGPSGLEVPIDVNRVLLAPQRQFMGFPPAPALPHAEILHHYHSAMLLTYFFLHDGGEAGAARLRLYLEDYRREVTEKGLHEIVLPDQITNDDERDEVGRLIAKRMVIQRNASKKAFAQLAAGRSDEALFAAMRQFYEERAIQLKAR